jgi:hypothetical protein
MLALAAHPPVPVDFSKPISPKHEPYNSLTLRLGIFPA